MAEQANKVACIRLDSGTQALVYLRQKKALEVDNHATATIGDNTFYRFHFTAT